MSRSIYTARHDALRAALISARKDAGLTQAELAARLKSGQSFVSKYERGERRLDVVEFFEVCAAIGVDGVKLLKQWNLEVGKAVSKAQFPTRQKTP